MKILFVHQNFPAQFGRLAAQMTTDPKNQVVFLTRDNGVNFGNIRKIYFKEHRPAEEAIHPYLRTMESAVIQGQAVYKAAMKLKHQGFWPDVIYGHSGFGATMILKDVFPNSAFVGLFEWYFNAHGAVHGFDPSTPVTFDDECRIRTQNMTLLTDLAACDAGVSPTQWQGRQFPPEFQTKLQIIHEGIDVAYFAPGQSSTLRLQEPSLDLRDAKEIVTYVARGMEPVRGFPQFMEAVCLLMKRRQNCHVVIVGADKIAYGFPHSSGRSYKELLMEKFEYDMSRLHFTGPLRYADYKNVLQASTVHVYLTYPYILSWSMLEAMSCGCALVASDTQPVKEVVTHEENGLLVDMFSISAVVDTIDRALDDPTLRAKLGSSAREMMIKQYDMHLLWPKHKTLLQSVIY